MSTDRLQRLLTWVRAYDDDATRLEAALSIIVIVAMVFGALSVSAAVVDVRTRYDRQPEPVQLHAAPRSLDPPPPGAPAVTSEPDAVGTRR